MDKGKFGDAQPIKEGSTVCRYCYCEVKQWVGLKEEEVNSIYAGVEKVVGEHWENGGTKLMFPFTLYEALEAKLKEKNGGC